jgi:hypothetical protein
MIKLKLLKILLLLFFIFFICKFLFGNNNIVVKRSYFEISNDSNTNMYKLSANQYKFPTFTQEVFDLYTSYFAKSQLWKDALQKAFSDTYKKYFGITLLSSSDDPLTFKQNVYNKLLAYPFKDNSDVSNFLALLITSYTPSIPSNYIFYTYEKIDKTRSFYSKHSDKISTLKDAVDASRYLNEPFFVYDDIITALDNSTDYVNTITNTPFNTLLTDVTYTYFDPMDIYIHPDRYRLNMGVGIMDTTQPLYTIYMSKNQLPFLNRLLKVSNNDSPLIHPFFDFPNYEVVWDDQWLLDMLTSYKTYLTNGKTMTDSFQGALSDLVTKQTGKSVSFDYTKASTYFNAIPSTFYWIITLLSMYDPSKTTLETQTLFQYMKSASYDPTICYEFCDKEKTTCMEKARLKQAAFDVICTAQPRGTPYAVVRECMNENLIIANQTIQLCTGTYNDACNLHCLTSGSSSDTYCTKDSDCSNGCGRRTGDNFEPLICCPSGTVNNLANGYDYCKNLPNGSVCYLNDMCASGYCAGNYDGFSQGVCSTKD